MKCLFCLLLIATVSYTASAQTIQYPKLSKTLDSLAYVDQWPMQQMFKQLPDSAGRDLVQVEKDNSARHQPILERIIKQIGYPGFRQVGEKSSSNFWLLTHTLMPIQHFSARY